MNIDVFLHYIVKWGDVTEKEIINFKNSDILFNLNTIEFNSAEIYRGLHAHNAIEVIKVQKGILNCVVGGKELSLAEGQIIIINRNFVHKIYSENAVVSYIQADILRYTLRFYEQKNSCFEDYILNYKANSHIVLDNESEIAELFDKIQKEYEDAREYSEMFIVAYLSQLAAFMYRCGLLLNFNSLTDECIEQILPIVEYINDNALKPITLEEICTAASYDKYYLCRIFKKVSGGTVFGYINFLRISRAVELLLEGEHTISQIALDCGFSSVQYFNRVFKNEIGCPPKKYKNYFYGFYAKAK